MAGDYRKSVRLETAEPERTIGRLARRHGVKARPVATYKVMPLVKTAVREHSREAGLICLEGVLDEINAGPEAARAAAQAWARGDVRGAIAGPRNFQRCLLALPGMSDLERKGTQDEVERVVGGDEDAGACGGGVRDPQPGGAGRSAGPDAGAGVRGVDAGGVRLTHLARTLTRFGGLFAAHRGGRPQARAALPSVGKTTGEAVRHGGKCSPHEKGPEVSPPGLSKSQQTKPGPTGPAA